MYFASMQYWRFGHSRIVSAVWCPGTPSSSIRVCCYVMSLQAEVTGDADGTGDLGGAVRLLQDSWKDLPSTLLCHILAIIPYKRTDVRSVCRSWRQAINSSIGKVNIPPADLPLLCTLPSIKHLTVQGVKSVPQSQQSDTQADGPSNSTRTAVRWPPCSVPAAGQATQSSCQISQLAQQQAGQQVNVWSHAVPSMLCQLEHLQLSQCEQEVQQLAAWLNSTGYNFKGVLTVGSLLESLRTLKISCLQCIEPLLQALLSLLQPVPGQHLHTECSTLSGGSSSNKHSMALQQLEDLSITQSVLLAPAAQHLNLLLQQLPTVRVLQLSSCHGMSTIPCGVWQCTGLTRLALMDNQSITQVDPGISQLVALKDLDLSACGMLRSLGSGLSHLTSLTTLNLSGPSGLWLDYSGQHLATTAAAAAAGLNPTAAASTSNGGSAAAAKAALPQLLLPALPHQQQHQLLGELASLTNLHTFILSHNRQLMVLPGCVSVMTGLRVLDVRGCGIRWLGDDVLQCVGLEELLLGDNVLDEIPPGVRRFTNLKILDVGGCGPLWSIPRALLQLKALEKLTVPSKGIGQHVIEQLELRGINPVEVIMDPADEELEDDMPGVDSTPPSDGGTADMSDL